MKGFEDTFSFLFDYAETIFSKGWHWFILLGAVLLLMTALFNGCTPDDIQPLNRNITKNNTLINLTNQTINNGNDFNISVGQRNRTAQNDSN